jgi:hypothetical protein
MHKNKDKRWEAQVYCQIERQWLEVDQLQDVCRQIRAETGEQGARFSEVTFMSDRIRGTSKLETFIEDDLLRAHFLRNPTLQIYCQLRKIIVHAHQLDYYGDFEFVPRGPIIRFCERNP